MQRVTTVMCWDTIFREKLLRYLSESLGNATDPASRLPSDMAFSNGFIFDFVPVQFIEFVVAWNNNNTRNNKN